MPDPAIGIIYSRLHPVITPAAFAVRIEALGFDAVWVTEGVANQMAALDPIVVMAAMAGATARIPVGSCVILSPLRNPAILAKEIASLDVLSGGRIVFGLGVGGTTLSQPADYRVTGIDPAERGARCTEGIEIMRKLWTGRRVSHRGRFHSFEDIVMEPVPVQRPGPPIWAGGSAAGVLRRAGALCDGFVPIGTGPADYARLSARVSEHAEAAGREPATITRAVHLYMALDESRAAARAVAERTLGARYGFTVTLSGEHRGVFGLPAECAATIAAYREVGATDFVLNPVSPIEEVVGQVERFAAEVLPRLR